VGIIAGSREVPGRNACDRRHPYLIIVIIICRITKVTDQNKKSVIIIIICHKAINFLNAGRQNNRCACHGYSYLK